MEELLRQGDKEKELGLPVYHLLCCVLLQCVAACCSSALLHIVAVCCISWSFWYVLQCIAAHCSSGRRCPECPPARKLLRLHFAHFAHCKRLCTLQETARDCKRLQETAGADMEGVRHARIRLPSHSGLKTQDVWTFAPIRVCLRSR